MKFVQWIGDPKQTLTPEQYARVTREDFTVLDEVSPTLYKWIESRPADIQACEWQRRMYGSTENPLWVWEAYRICRKASTPLPEWLLSAFDHTAKQLHELTAQKPSGREWRGPVLAALGFGQSRVAEERRRQRASKLLDQYEALSDEETREKKRREIGTFFGRAPRGAGGPQHPVSAWQREGRDAGMAAQVYRLVEDGQPQDRACKAVATREGVGRSSVWRAWLAYLYVVAAGHQREV